MTRCELGGGLMSPQEYGLIKIVYSVSETMQILSIGRTTLYQVVKRGYLRPVKLGRKTLFPATDLARLLDLMKEGRLTGSDWYKG
jgi:excisionase family DNA binding protein